MPNNATDNATETVTEGVADPYAAAESETTQGKVYTVTGQDWDSIVSGIAEDHDDKVVVNMGPQHPSTHGVLRLILELEGETVTEARCGIGYLHTGIEKNMEYRSWTQGVTFCTRMDYLSPFYNEMTYVLGVGRSTANDVLKKVGVDPDTYVKDLTEEETVKLRDAVEDIEVEGDLRRDRSQNIKRLSEIGSYRGLRHRRGLPVRGQNTKTNARTRKGPKRMQVAGKKKAGKK